MKAFYTLFAVCLVLLLNAPPALQAAANDEAQAIAVLQSGASPQEKDAACVRLKRIGTAAAVPALAALLADEQLGHSARYALESMPAPEAGQALLSALSRTTGLPRAGVIQSLGLRRERQAVSNLGKLLTDTDTESALAAAHALGLIGGGPALFALDTAFPNATGKLHLAVADGLLACGNQLLLENDKSSAARVFERLYGAKEPPFIRQAAYRGMLLAAGTKSLPMVISALKTGDAPSQMAALQVARDLQAPGATKELCQLLKDAPATMQAAIVEALVQRQDPAAVSAILPLAKSPDEYVRATALASLGTLGDATACAMLVQAAATPADQKTARQALLQIRVDLAASLVEMLPTAKPAEQNEIVRALAGRGEKGTADRLITLAKEGNEPSQIAALRAMGQLATPAHFAALVQIIEATPNETVRAEAGDTLASLCRRVGNLEVQPLTSALAKGTPASQATLLQVCSELRQPEVRAALRTAVKSTDNQVRTAAIRALCNTRDAELLPDLLALTREAAEANLRPLAARGYVRLATDEEAIKVSPAQRFRLLKDIYAAATRPEEKRLVLAKAAGIADLEALNFTLEAMSDPALQNEAAQAATQIASALSTSQPQRASEALKKVLATATDDAAKKAATAALDRLDAMKDFLTSWQVSGPYLQAGKDFTALFDIVFPPETPGAAGATWKALPAGTDPKQPYLLDLLKALGGESRVAYVRTSVYSEIEQPARLEIGSDDGVKVWLNGKQVHANNVPRAVTVGADKVAVTLKKGWNTLMFKINQNNQGWGFCAKFAKPDGSRLTGLQCDANRE
jgi:HEAT repeat protein